MSTVSRRRFCQSAALASLFPAALAQTALKSGITARQVVARIQQNVGVPWRTPTADEFKVGDPDAPVTGITTTFMSTLDVLERSVAAGNNFIITHEPTFWSANDEVAVLRHDPLYKAKLDYLRAHRLTVFRFHDHWHAHRPADGIFTGWNKAMGWDAYAVDGKKPFQHQYLIPEATLESVAGEMARRLHLRSVRVVGDPHLKIRRVGNAGHYIAQCMQLLPDVDLILTFECREWEAAEYIRDAIATGQKKALIQLSHEGGEEAGMDECATWLKTFITEVPVQFLPAGDPFWMAS